MFRRSDGFQLHLRTHTDERPYMCSECSQSFRQLAHLKAHKRKCHGYEGKTKTIDGINEVASKSRYYYCSFCYLRSKGKTIYIRHLMNNHMGKDIKEGESLWFFYCDVNNCLISCTNQDTLKTHFHQSHEKLLDSGCSEFPQCNICQRIFVMQENLDIHKRFHLSKDNENQLKFDCGYCYVVFQSENELKEHLPRHQIRCVLPTYYLCDVCGNGYKDLSSVIFHKRKCHNKSTNTITTSGKVKTRIRIEDCQRNYECWLCFNWYKNRGYLLRHLKEVHLDKEIKDGDTFWFYDCDVKECFASCANVNQLGQHYENSHSDLLGEKINSQFYKCQTCQRVFALHENLEQHQNCHSEDLSSQSKFSCDYCCLLFQSASECNDHQSVHKIPFDLSEFCHKCYLCGKGFRNQNQLCQHKNIVHREKAIKKTDHSPEFDNTVGAKDVKRYVHQNELKCTICSFIASTPTNLQLHTEKIHPDVETPFKLLTNDCQFCEKSFYMPSELHRHSIKYHSSEYLNGKSFCQACFHIFGTQEEMETHFKTLHQNLICSVETCGKRFTTKVNMWRHMNIHKKEKPFICEYCPEGFPQEAALQYHINKKHTFHRSFFCKLCPDNPGYYERASFKKHMEKEHPTFAVKEILITKYPKRKYFF